MKILIINGPNLNLLGKRQTGFYGDVSFEDYLEKLRSRYKELEISYFQSNKEGELIDHIQAADHEADAIILNGAGYSHTSISMADAIQAISIPVVEVHISNVYARETYRHHSFLSAHCKGVIVGMGLDGYRLAIEHLIA